MMTGALLEINTAFTIIKKWYNMAKIISSVSRVDRPSTKRPGVHAKKKTSRLKSSKNYKKPYRGQGRAWKNNKNI